MKKPPILLVDKLLDFDASEVAVIDLAFSHPVQAVQHCTSVESLQETFFLFKLLPLFHA